MFNTYINIQWCISQTQQHFVMFFLTFCWACISVYLSQYLTNLMHKICFTISFISRLYMFRAHVLIITRYHHIYRCDDTRGCAMQFWPPDDEHMCSKHVQAWNKTVKQIFCIKLVKYWDKFIMFIIVRGWGCFRTWCWGEYLDLGGTR